MILLEVRVSMSLENILQLIFVTVLVAILIASVIGRIAMINMVRCRIPLKIICNGDGRHIRNREVWAVHLGPVILVRCELCGVEYRQRAERFVEIVAILQDRDITELPIEALPKRKRS